MFSEKETIRREVLSRRNGLDPETVNLKSESIKDLFLTTHEFAASRFALFYAAMKGEVQTVKAVAEAVARGKRVALPKVEHNELRVFEVKSYHDTREGAFGILEPVEGKSVEIDPVCLDLIVVPGVAFDEKGGRIGFGKGFYDRFLRSLSRKSPFVGLAFEFQIVEKAVVTEDDIPMDFVITEKRIIDCGQNRNLDMEKGAEK